MTVTAAETMQNFETLQTQIQRAHTEISRIVIGQDAVIAQTLIALLSGGHALLIGAPGLAKTLLVETIGEVIGLSSNRIQSTPDLMPADILGSEVLEDGADGKRHFRFIAGPVFTQLLMADEINRASPRTQSALLQAMQEKEVSIAGEKHALPTPFHVLATQNPIEQEGTYPLPEAQLDRFLMQINVSYPDAAAETQIALSTTTNAITTPDNIMSTQDLIAAQHLIREMPVGETVTQAVVSLIRALRPENNASIAPYISWPPGPRATQSLMLAIRARAFLEGRTAPLHDDIHALALPVLRHRMGLTYTAQADGETVETLIKKELITQ